MMMNRNFLMLLILMALGCAVTSAQFVIDGITYQVDTLVHRQVGLAW